MLRSSARLSHWNKYKWQTELEPELKPNQAGFQDSGHPKFQSQGCLWSLRRVSSSLRFLPPSTLWATSVRLAISNCYIFMIFCLKRQRALSWIVSNSRVFFRVPQGVFSTWQWQRYCGRSVPNWSKFHPAFPSHLLGYWRADKTRVLCVCRRGFLLWTPMWEATQLIGR